MKHRDSHFQDLSKESLEKAKESFKDEERPGNKKMDVHFSSKKQDWETPKAFFDKLNEEFKFNVDVCALSHNAKLPNYYSPECQDSLEIDWKCTEKNTVCWMNPPYSDLLPRIKKAYEQAQKGCKVVCLIPARTDTEAFHKYILPYSGINSNNLRYAWAAGIIDGEGCIRVNKSNPTKARRTSFPVYNLLIAVKMTDFATIEKLQGLFGGRIQDDPQEHKRDLKRWEVTGEHAKDVLEKVYPHLLTKQYQAQLGIEFQLLKQRKGTHKVTQEYLDSCQSFYE